MLATTVNLLLEVLVFPGKLRHLEAQELDQVLRYAERCQVLGILGRRVAASGGIHQLSPVAQDRILGALIWADELARALRWEIRFVRKAMERLGIPVLVLKGGAYLMGEFQNADGRLVSDLDLMVPLEQLPVAEQALLAAGYEYQKIDDYDQRYYREWMHELPPVAHPNRGLVADLHHNIAPPVSRLKIDAKQLFDRAVPLVDGFLRLGNEDLILHLCVHMFHDGELNNALRELLDLDSLLRHFGKDARFWDGLVIRADEMGLQRPMFYGVASARAILGTPVPSAAWQAIEKLGPVWSAPMLAMMRRAILPDLFDDRSSWRGLAVALLYWRSHWLRMPPGMLVKHLLTQMKRRGGLKRGEQVIADG